MSTVVVEFEESPIGEVEFVGGVGYVGGKSDVVEKAVGEGDSEPIEAFASVVRDTSVVCAEDFGSFNPEIFFGSG